MNKERLFEFGKIAAIVVCIILVIAAWCYIADNTCEEVMYVSGTVVGQDHDVWYTDDGVKRDTWKTKVKADDGTIFTDSGYFAYDNTYIGEEVKVKKKYIYYKDKHVATTYDIVIE